MEHATGAGLTAELTQAEASLAAAPFAGAVQAGMLPLASYGGLLSSLRGVYRALSDALPAVSPLPPVDVASRLQALDADLAHLGPAALPDAPVAMLETELLAQRIRRRSLAAAPSLAGYLVALERAVPAVLPPDQVAEAFGLHDTRGRQFCSSAPRPVELHHWLGQLSADTAAAQLAAACEALRGLLSIVDALYPLDPDAQRELARILNPSAGAHGVPGDNREVRAALRAGERTLQDFPYYTLRYGERGEQFTRSDSAWLVTLTDHRLDVVEQQVLWLGRLLSARGMPQLLLELHLETLHAELVAAVPEKRAAYATLQAVSESLGAMRTRALPEAAFGTFEARFAAAVGAEWDRRLPHTGRLLAAAVADEQCGIRQAVRSVEDWMADAERFPPIWVNAVRQTIVAARRQATRHQA